jgi:uncharacterized OsmC-like protein
MRVTVRTGVDGSVVGEARGRSVVIQLAGQEQVFGLRPTELLLIGLGGCLMGFACDYSRLKGLANDWQMHLEDQVEAGPGIAEINVFVSGSAASNAEEMAELMQIIQRRCKLYNTLAFGVRVNLRVAESVPTVSVQERRAAEHGPGSSCGLGPGDSDPTC